MIVRTLMPLAAWAGCLLVTTPAGAQPPSPTPAKPAQPASAAPGMTNQQLANSVKAALEKSGQLKGRPVSVVCRDGKVELTGAVASASQREAIIMAVIAVPGVRTVNHNLTVTGTETGVVTAQALSGPPTNLPSMPTSAPIPMSPSPSPSPMMGHPVMGGPMPGGPVMGGPVAGGPVPGMPGTDPVPMAGAPVPSPYDMNPPRLPSYAWPTYAPYNNFGRVAYPEAYPYNAWPFIGPFYPFPKVPPGWRKVFLEWDDGHWYYGRAGTGYDRWRIRYW